MDWKKIGKALLFPHIAVVLALIPVAAVLLVYAMVVVGTESVIAYVSYVLSAYTLTVAVLFCIKTLPSYIRRGKERVYSNKYGNRYMTDPAYRTHVSLYVSLTANLLYVAVNLVSHFLYGSAWFAILAGYYCILSVMRFLLVRYVHKVGIGVHYVGELKRARVCSAVLLSLNLILSGAVLMILYQNKGYEYHGILIYVMAAYTFYITVHAIVGLFKYRKFNSPVMSVAKIISLASALVSMLSLETAMLTEFADETTAEGFDRIMIAATGGGISVIIVTLAIYMILRTGKELKQIREEAAKHGE